MIRIMDAKGVPVICLKDDGRAGYLSDPLYDEYNSVCGFLVDTQGWSLGKKYIALEDILRISNNSCIIYSENSIRHFTKKLNLRRGGELDKMVGRTVIDRQGNGLGIVRDIVFDIETGNVEGFELSRGFMEDIVQGRNLILLRDGVEFGEEFIIVNSGADR